MGLLKRPTVAKPCTSNSAAKATRRLRCHPSSMSIKASASPSFQGCDTPLDWRIKVVGMGSCGIDYLASVAAYPKPDEKLRTETLETQGGGNCANALTAAARLGLAPVLVSKIGGDGLGDAIISELQADGVDTSHVLRAAGHPSPFTYIIVDRQGGTRTCIHTPGAPLSPAEISPALMDAVLSDAVLVYFDGRLTEAALLLAREARRRGVPVLVEAERLRPGLESLLAEATWVVTSEHFPRDWTGESWHCDAVLSTFQRLPHVRWLVTTLGSRGALMLERRRGRGRDGSRRPGTEGPAALPSQQQQQQEPELQQAAGEGADDPWVGGDAPLREVTLEELVERELRAQVEAEAVAEGVTVGEGGGEGEITAGTAAAAGAAEPAVVCVSSSGVRIGAGRVATTEGFVRLGYAGSRDPSRAAHAAHLAAARAAALNADSAGAARYLAGTAAAAAAAPTNTSSSSSSSSASSSSNSDTNATAAASEGAAPSMAGAAGGDTEEEEALVARVTLASIARMPKSAVVDTTGAGDSFIGSMLYGIATRMPLPGALRLAAVVAGCKCTAL
ncbi:hypothetical protein Agub_g10089, partial [Astrephomene gubernaculifera]